MNEFFKPAGDLPIENSKQKIENYLLSVVSGKKYDSVCELGTLCGGGRIIVSFDELKEMVDRGCNIINAQYINSNMIEIEFQEFRNDRIGRRGR